MKAFYSILYITPIPSINEQLSIGLFLVDENNVFFKFSNEKLNRIKKIISQGSFNFIKSYLSGLNKEITSNRNIKRESNELFTNTVQLNDFKEHYFKRLSVYNNNLIRFSQPVNINQIASEESLNGLFKQFVFNGETNLDRQSQENKIKLIKKDLYPKIEIHVNTDFKSSFLSKSGILFDTPIQLLPNTINIIGRNERIVTGQFINFEMNEDSIEFSLNKYLSLQNAINENNKTKSPICYLIGDEPNKELKKQHQLWKDISEYNKFTYLPNNDIFELENYLEVHQVQRICQE